MIFPHRRGVHRTSALRTNSQYALSMHPVGRGFISRRFLSLFVERNVGVLCLFLVLTFVVINSRLRREINPRPTLYRYHRELRINANRTTDGRPYDVERTEHTRRGVHCTSVPRMNSKYALSTHPVGACIARPRNNAIIRITFCNRITSYVDTANCVSRQIGRPMVAQYKSRRKHRKNAQKTTS